MTASRMTIGQRFVALVALCGLAILVPALLHGHAGWTQWQLLQRESQGLVPARALLEVVRLSQQHRGLSAAWLGGDAAQEGARAAKAVEVDKAMAVVDALLQAEGAQAAPVTRLWREASAASIV